MQKVKAWLLAARLRTLPLSISGILVGTALASVQGHSDHIIFILALLTTVGFQVTSNFANDYGDGVKGTDNEDRIGPLRALQSGVLDRKELKRGIIVSIAINLFLVVLLLLRAFASDQPEYIFIFAFLGLLSIWAAIKYTVGADAYGYRGYGDIFVFVFFGLVSVLGSLFLYSKSLFPAAFLPAATIGLLSTAVLNLNNMRDLEPDRMAGKQTLAVILGAKRARIYHLVLVLGSMVCLIFFISLYAHSLWHWTPLIAFLPLIAHMFRIEKINQAGNLDPELKKIALSTFLLALLFYLTYYFL